MLKLLQNYSSNKIGIIILEDSKSRKLFHNYLESRFPHVKKTSLHCPVVNEKYKKYCKCWDCDNLVLLDRYNYGYMENNQDETCSGICKNCGCIITWECNYESLNGFCAPENNIIAFGKYFDGYIPPKNSSIICGDEDFEKIIKNNKIIYIDSPEKSYNKSSLGKYIGETIKHLI